MLRVAFDSLQQRVDASANLVASESLELRSILGRSRLRDFLFVGESEYLVHERARAAVVCLHRLLLLRVAEYLLQHLDLLCSHRRLLLGLAKAPGLVEAGLLLPASLRLAAPVPGEPLVARDCPCGLLRLARRTPLAACLGLASRAPLAGLLSREASVVLLLLLEAGGASALVDVVAYRFGELLLRELVRILPRRHLRAKVLVGLERLGRRAGGLRVLCLFDGPEADSCEDFVGEFLFSDVHGWLGGFLSFLEERVCRLLFHVLEELEELVVRRRPCARVLRRGRPVQRHRARARVARPRLRLSVRLGLLRRDREVPRHDVRSLRLPPRAQLQRLPLAVRVAQSVRNLRVRKLLPAPGPEGFKAQRQDRHLRCWLLRALGARGRR